MPPSARPRPFRRPTRSLFPPTHIDYPPLTNPVDPLPTPTTRPCWLFIPPTRLPPLFRTISCQPTSQSDFLSLPPYPPIPFAPDRSFPTDQPSPSPLNPIPLRQPSPPRLLSIHPSSTNQPCPANSSAPSD